MGLKGFERRLERLVEGAFTRAFRSSLRPVELGRRLVREMDDQRTVDVHGDLAAPNHFTVTLGPEDHAQFADIEASLSRELAEAARTHARDAGYHFMGPVEVILQVDEELRAGSFGLSARMKESKGGGAAGSLVLPGGSRTALAGRNLVIGRAPDSDLHLADSSVSRRHAEVRPAEGGYVVVDLGSTNGTRVNGGAVKERALRDGDTIAVGDVQLRYEAS
jgi:hypothetical protein